MTPDVTELREAIAEELIASWRRQGATPAWTQDEQDAREDADALIAGPLAPILDEVERLEDVEQRLGKLLWWLTDGLLSKTGYSVEATVQEIESTFEKHAEEDRAVLQADFNSTFEALQEAGAENVQLRATLDQVRAVCDEYPPTASTNPTDPEAMRRSARYAVASRFRRILDAADGENAGDQDADLDYMCPNCCTPRKCNGPHIPEGSLPEGSQAALDRFAEVVKSMGQSVAYLNERTDGADWEGDHA